MDQSLTCRIEETAETVMIIAGELDAHSAAVVEDTFDRWVETSGCDANIDRIDATQVSFISAAGITVLLRVSLNQRTRIDASSIVARIITLCGVGEVLAVAHQTP